MLACNVNDKTFAVAALRFGRDGFQVGAGVA